MEGSCGGEGGARRAGLVFFRGGEVGGGGGGRATELGFWLLGAMSLVLMWRYRRRFDLRHWGMWGGFLVLGTSTLRHAALFAAVAGPMLVRGWELMEEEFSGEKEKKARVERFYKLVLAVVGIVAVVEGGGGLAGGREINPKKVF